MVTRFGVKSDRTCVLTSDLADIIAPLIKKIGFDPTHALARSGDSNHVPQISVMCERMIALMPKNTEKPQAASLRPRINQILKKRTLVTDVVWADLMLLALETHIGATDLIVLPAGKTAAKEMVEIAFELDHDENILVEDLTPEARAALNERADVLWRFTVGYLNALLEAKPDPYVEGSGGGGSEGPPKGENLEELEQCVIKTSERHGSRQCERKTAFRDDKGRPVCGTHTYLLSEAEQERMRTNAKARVHRRQKLFYQNPEYAGKRTGNQKKRNHRRTLKKVTAYCVR